MSVNPVTTGANSDSTAPPVTQPTQTAMPPIPAAPSASAAASLAGRVTPPPQRSFEEFNQSLLKWQQQAAGTPAYPKRLIAAKAILLCHPQANDSAWRPEHLNLGLHCLTALPNCLDALHDLKGVHAGGNLLKSNVPTNWPPNMKYLGLGSNQLKTFPGNLPPTLQELILNENELTGLPSDLCTSLPSLKILTLDRNQLTSLPPDLPPTLTHLNVMNNQLTVLPLSLARLPATATIYAEQNPFTEEGVQTFIEERNKQRAIDPTKGPRFITDGRLDI